MVVVAVVMVVVVVLLIIPKFIRYFLIKDSMKIWDF